MKIDFAFFCSSPRPFYLFFVVDIDSDRNKKISVESLQVFVLNLCLYCRIFIEIRHNPLNSLSRLELSIKMKKKKKVQL